MEPTQNPNTNPNVAAQPESLGQPAVEAQPQPVAPEVQAQPAAPAVPAPVAAQQPVQLPQVPAQPADQPPQPQAQQPTAQPAPQTAQDVDVIEKEWVDQANRIVEENKDNPYAEEEAVEALQMDYLKKRYGHDVKKPNQ